MREEGREDGREVGKMVGGREVGGGGREGGGRVSQWLKHRFIFAQTNTTYCAVPCLTH